jgi:hypothetical protein
MAQPNYTPILLYYSTTALATPQTANLALGELALNIADGKLYYKDAAGVLKTIASTASAAIPFAVSSGGTGIQTLTQGGIAYGGATTYAFTAIGSAGDLLSSNGAGAPTWITPTNVNTVSTVVKRDSSGNFAAGTITASLTGTASTATNLAGGALGSMPYQTAAGTTAFVPAGSPTNVLTISAGGIPTWAATGTAASASNLSGGTAGAVVYQSAPNTTAFLAAGTSGQVLALTSAQLPAWTTLSAVTSVANLSGGATNKIPYQSTTSVTAFIDAPPTSGPNYLKYTGSAFVWANPVTSVSAGTGMSFTTITDTGSVAINTNEVATFANAGTFTATQSFVGSSSAPCLALDNALESCTITGSAASGAINIDIATQSVIVYSTPTTNPWSINFRASSGTPLSSFMSQGQSVTVAVLVQVGAVTNAYNTSVTIDGSPPTSLIWQGGSAPITGNANSLDVYSYTIIRTGPSSYVVLAAQTRFA